MAQPVLICEWLRRICDMYVATDLICIAFWFIPRRPSVQCSVNACNEIMRLSLTLLYPGPAASVQEMHEVVPQRMMTSTAGSNDGTPLYRPSP